MKNKKIVGTFLAATVALSATFTGCSLVSTNSRADMEQVIAEVNITDSVKFENSEIGRFGDAVGTTEVVKRDLIAYFINSGATYVSSGYTYKEVFEMLMDSLVNNAVLTQYSIMYLLNEKAKEAGNTQASVMETYSAFETDIEKYEYILGEDSDEVKIAYYSLMSSLNSTIDSYEEQYLTDDDGTSGTSSRTTPSGVDTEQEDYYPDDGEGNLNYNVYTGYSGYLLSESGTYKDDRDDLLKNNSSRSTRIKAYNEYMGNLIDNYLVDPFTEDLKDVLSLEYVQTEYATQLESQIINKYCDLYEEEQAEKLRDGDYEYLIEKYNDIFDSQSKSYDSADSFTTAMGEMSDTSFILYAPDSSSEDGKVEQGTYGFVYNILLPFSAAQSAALTALKADYAFTDYDVQSNKEEYGTLSISYKPEFYTERNNLLRNIKTTDQRDAWFNGTTDYSFKSAGTAGDDYFGTSGWLFFENNLTDNDRYEALDKYVGKYAYNGTVTEADDDYILIGNELTIDQMLGEFRDYVNFVLGTDSVSFDDGYDPSSENTAYYKNYTLGTLLTETDDEWDIDYSNFVYATGKVDFGEATELDNRQNLLKNGNDDGEPSVQYLALSAVNELQYAYTTDTGVLSQYLGYSVATGDSTGYIKEFEYAAQQAIANGAGSFAVCAGDYGWHLIYVTYTFDNEGGAQYEPDWSKFEQEGTFEYYFYEMIKSTNVSNISTTRRTQIINKFNDDSTVVKYESRYKNLLELDSES